MDANNITENILTAIDIISKGNLDGIKYDKTITCTIVDDSLREEGQYIVTDGSSRFTAYSENTSYKNDTIVYVTVPNGDFTQQKIITGKKITNNKEPFKYIEPFDTFIPCTQNIFAGEEEYSLTANGTQEINSDGDRSTGIKLFSKTINNSFKGFNRLGIKANFRSWLRDKQIKSGDYGLIIEVTGKKKDAKQTVSTDAEDPNKTIIKIEEIYITDQLKFSTKDFLGNPYSFETFFTQEKVFDISSFEEIIDIKISFFENGQFKDKDDKLIIPEKDADDEYIKNLFVSNIELYLGLNIEEVGDEYVQLFTYDAPNYGKTDKPIENMKTIYLRWAHKEGNKTYILDNNNLDVFVQDKLDEIENAETGFEWRLDTNEVAQEDRVYYEREIVEGNTHNITFWKNTSDLWQPGRDYYKKDFFPIKYEENVINGVKFHRYLDEIKPFDDNFKYEKDTIYFEKVSENDYIQTTIFDKNSFKKGKSYAKWSFDQVNDDTANVIEGYLKLDNISEDTPKEELYNYYYAEYTLDKNNSGQYGINYSEIDNSQYKKGKYYYKYIKPEDIFRIEWYHYKEGEPAADQWSGVYWENITNKETTENAYENTNHLVDQFTFELHPDFIYNKTEQVKAIVFYNDIPYYSNIITFENNSTTINIPTLEQETALSANFEDGSLGNYYLYDEANQLIDVSQASKNRCLKLYFSLNNKTKSQLVSAEKVTWKFPLENTMIKVLQSSTFGAYREEDGFGIIEDTELRNGYELFYNIEKYYSYTKNNNTIVCTIIKNGVTYSTTANFSFGQSGSNGSDYTLTLDLLTTDNVVTLEPTNNLYYGGFVEAEIIPDGVTKYAKTDNVFKEDNISGTYRKAYIKKDDNTVAISSDNVIIGAYYYSSDNKTFSQVNTFDINEEVKIQATLYDQNHQKVDLKKYDISWSWMGNENEVLKKEDQSEENNILLLDMTRDKFTINDIRILKATLNNFGNYPLKAYLPIPIRKDFGPTRFQGPTQIIYGSLGAPNYYKDEICLYYNDEEGNEQPYPLSGFSILTKEKGKKEEKGMPAYLTNNYYPVLIENKTGGKINSVHIQPLSMYIQELGLYAIQYKYNNKILWTQPILNIQNRYFSSTINKWDGSLKVDEKGNTILATMIGAGKKESDNSFSGVIMGDWSGKINSDNKETMLGLYGFHKGVASFGFKVDGTAFIGKSGNGRIEFEGDTGQIKSSAWQTSNLTKGMCIDLDNGWIDMSSSSGSIRIDSSVGENNFPFIIQDSAETTYTKIGWNGRLELSASKTGKGKISLNASADKYPLNINDNLVIDWAGNLEIGPGFTKTGAKNWNLQATANGILTSKGGFFDNCNANIFTILASDTTTKKLGTIGLQAGSTESILTNNIGIYSNADVGIKLNSQTNMSLKAVGEGSSYEGIIDLRSKRGVKMYMQENGADEYFFLIQNEKGTKPCLKTNIPSANQEGIYARFA